VANFNRQLTGNDIVRAVCAQMGLPMPISATGEPNNRTAAQMWALLNSEGIRLLKPASGYRWQVLNRTWNLTTVPGQAAYDLPDDWDSFIDQTGWSKSMAQPMGPLSPQGWAVLSAHMLSTTLAVYYRMRGGKFELFNVPDTAQDLFIDYTSRAWVQASGTAGAFKDHLTEDSDLCLYDAELICAALKLRWLTEKGFDTSVAQNAFDLLLELAINTDTEAPVISADGGGSRGARGHGSYVALGDGLAGPIGVA